MAVSFSSTIKLFGVLFSLLEKIIKLCISPPGFPPIALIAGGSDMFTVVEMTIL